MSASVVAPPNRMAVEEFLAWSDRQTGSDRYKLVNGEVFGMAGDRVRHNRLKFAAAQALDAATLRVGAPCTAFTDGVAVRIDEWTLRIPDASVQCGPKADPDAMVIEPTIALDVTSPSSVRSDEDQKLIEYMSVASIRHYLIVHPASRAVVHHERDPEESVTTGILREGDAVTLDQPGIEVMVADLLSSHRRRV